MPSSLPPPPLEPAAGPAPARSGWLPRFLRRPSAFFRAARARGLPARVAWRLESVAREVAPLQPESVLLSRDLLEKAALRAAVGDGGNLELSFAVVDALAAAFETLELVRSNDVLDPFRRVWVSAESQARRRGVVLSCRDGELTVFCPHQRSPVPRAGTLMTLGYRGFASQVEYKVKLDDPVRLPGGLMLNLTRVVGQGNLGRVHQRFAVKLQAVVRPRPDEIDVGNPFLPCEVLDLSAGGLRLECAASFEAEQIVQIEVPLPDGDGQPFAALGVVRWVRRGTQERHGYGLLFHELPQPSLQRLERFMATLRPS
jgi:hypothetical protein